MKSFQCSSKGKMIQPGTLLCGLCLISGEQTLGLEERSVVGREGLSVLRPCTFLSSDQCPWEAPLPCNSPPRKEQVIYLLMVLFPVTSLGLPFCPSMSLLQRLLCYVNSRPVF